VSPRPEVLLRQKPLSPASWVKALSEMGKRSGLRKLLRDAFVRGAEVNHDAFRDRSARRVKEQMERLTSRITNMKKSAEKTIHTASTVLFVNAAAGGFGYVNERWGPANDPSGLKELTLLGVPADLGIGAAGLIISLFGGLGRYEDMGLSVSNGALAAFTYRFGAEFARKQLTAAPTTKGAPPQMAAGAEHWGAWGQQPETQYADGT